MPAPGVQRGTGPEALPQGSAAQINQQLEEARKLYEQHIAQVEQMKTALAAGDITEKQYNQAIDAQWNAKIQQVLEFKKQQGVPMRDPFSPEPVSLPAGPPEGVEFGQPQAPQKLASENDQLVYGQPGTGLGRPSRELPPPQGTYDWLESLIQLAQMPDAPPQVLQLLRLVMSSLGS